MVAEIGRAAIWLSVFSCLWAIALLLSGLRYKNYNAILSGRNGVVGTFVLISVATGALIYGFVTNDFSMKCCKDCVLLFRKSYNFRWPEKIGLGKNK